MFTDLVHQPRPSSESYWLKTIAPADSGRASIEWDALPELLTRQRQGRREGYHGGMQNGE